MIHQFIFASPKPGMTEADFQSYWVEVHAVQYASKIRQIKKYKVDTRIDRPGDAGKGPMFGGIAEIWIENEEEQLASLQSPEFLQGARLDEPKWAAFWKTLVLDTDAHVVVGGGPETRESPGIKVVALVRRKQGMTVDAFRRFVLGTHADHAREIPGCRRLLMCTTRDSWYGFGEPRFDMVGMMWFDGLSELEAAAASPAWHACQADQPHFLEERHLFSMVVKEHWIIGPEARG